MDTEQLNGWTSFTAIAVNVQEEIETFKRGKVLTGLGLACVNRLKVITTIATYALAQLLLVFHATFLLSQGELTLKNFTEIAFKGTICNCASVIFGLCALPATEFVLQGIFLNPLSRLNDKMMPYMAAGLKNIDIRRFEKVFFKIAEETRDHLLAEGKLQVDELQICDPHQIQFLFRATILEMMKQWELKNSNNRNRDSISFGKKGQSESIVKLNNLKEEKTPTCIGDLGHPLQQAMEAFEQFSETQKEMLEELFLDKKTIEDVTQHLSEEEQTLLTSFLGNTGILEHVFTQYLLNAHKNFELVDKAQALFMCTE